MKPQNWNEVDESQYKPLDEYYAGKMHCTGAFTKDSFGKTITIIFYENGDFQADTFDKILEYINNVNEENYLIDGDPNAPDFEDTSSISYLYCKQMQMGEYDALMSIARVLVDENKYSIVCQINYEKDGKHCSVQYAMPEFDKEDINGSLKRDGTLAEIAKYLGI